MKIVSLVDNIKTKGRDDSIGTEHGLSLYIEVNEKKILFDMGKSDLFVKNAKELGIDLSLVDYAVLSHGHYDHGGGLETFLALNDHARVYLSSYAFGKQYHGKIKYIGIDQKLKSSHRLSFVSEQLKIDDKVFLFPTLGEIRYPIEDDGLTVKQGEYFCTEDFRHEQYLWMEEKGQRVLISGCSHRGIANIAEEFMPDIVIGGFHFFHHPLDEQLDRRAEDLNRLPIKYYTCHCTGWEQYCRMKKHMHHLYYLGAGDIIEL